MNIPLDKSVYLICGDDEFRVDTAARELINALVPKEDREFGLEKIDARGVEVIESTLELLRDIRDTLFANDLFGSSEKTLWLLETPFLANERLIKSDDVKEALTPLIEQIKKGLPEGSRLVVSTSKINRTQPFYKAIKAKGYVLDFGSNLRQNEREQAAEIFIAESLPKVGLKMDAKTIRHFVQRAGADFRQLHSELNKLACYCGDRKEATVEDVDEIITAASVSEIWDFTDAFASRNAAKLALQIRKQLNQGENAIRLTTSILSCVSTMLFLRDAIDKGWATPASRSINWSDIPEDVDIGLALSEKDIRKTLTGFRAQKTFEQACLWKTSELRAARHHVLALREALVSCQIPEETLLNLYLIRALGTRNKPANSRKV